MQGIHLVRCIRTGCSILCAEAEGRVVAFVEDSPLGVRGQS